MMLQLQRYNFEVVYKRGKELYNADTLSRAALEKTNALDLKPESVFRVELAEMNIKPSTMSNETFKRVYKKR